jgi:hypothetical protein
MTHKTPLLAVLSSLLPLLAACDGQQYVNPDTVALSITKTSSGTVLVQHCNYVPVLLGSEVQASYKVEADLTADLTITRDSISVAFEGGGVSVDPFVATADDVQSGAQTAPDPPVGLTVQLAPGCKPDP